MTKLSCARDSFCTYRESALWPLKRCHKFDRFLERLRVTKGFALIRLMIMHPDEELIKIDVQILMTLPPLAHDAKDSAIIPNQHLSSWRSFIGLSAVRRWFKTNRLPWGHKIQRDRGKSTLCSCSYGIFRETVQVRPVGTYLHVFCWEDLLCWKVAPGTRAGLLAAAPTVIPSENARGSIILSMKLTRCFLPPERLRAWLSHWPL